MQSSFERLEERLVSGLSYFLPQKYQKAPKDIAEAEALFSRIRMIAESFIGLFFLTLFEISKIKNDTETYVNVMPFVILLHIITIIDLRVSGKRRSFLFMSFLSVYCLLPLQIIDLYQSSWVILPWIFVVFTVFKDLIPRAHSYIGLCIHCGLILLLTADLKEVHLYKIETTRLIKNIAFASMVYFFFEVLDWRFQSRLRKLRRSLRKNEHLKKLIASLSHEINNPLMIAMGSLDHFMTHSDPALLDRISRSLERISEILKTIRKVEEFEETTYLGEIKMLDLYIQQREKSKSKQTNDLKKIQDQIAALINKEEG